ncbi:CbrC family protein [Chryseobacterium indologenes]|uniref:CbrC family protein n=1 Tax=Chryseobacterium indologenes TaxID=253 RepID=UPI002578CEE9|nr:CbrC family protein [Chryseobacterium indologenes]MDM1554417.1 CbrC family protein [Chryseobacterium indologenes]
MGQLFELISDDALEKLDEYYTECHVCEKPDVDLYPYQGQIILENGEIDDDIYAACHDCLQSKPMAHSCSFLYEKTIEKYLYSLNLPHPRKIELKTVLTEKYNRTPDIPIFMQRPDIPLCCEDITEFIGYPQNDKELYEASENFTYWEEGIEEKSEYYDFRTHGSPESLREIAIFQCSHCRKKYFTFQFT